MLSISGIFFFRNVKFVSLGLCKGMNPIIVIGFETSTANAMLLIFCTAELSPESLFLLSLQKSFLFFKATGLLLGAYRWSFPPVKAPRRWSLRPAHNMPSYHTQGLIYLYIYFHSLLRAITNLQLAHWMFKDYKVNSHQVLCRTNSECWSVS